MSTRDRPSGDPTAPAAPGTDPAAEHTPPVTPRAKAIAESKHPDTAGARSATEHTDTPLVRVVRGAPTPDELAALVGVLLGRRRPDAPKPAPAAPHWARSGNPAHLNTLPGPDAWRRSGLPA